MDKSEYTVMRVSRATLTLFRESKVHHRETDDECLTRLLRKLGGVSANE